MEQVDLAWWPPDPEEPIGEERARELVAELRRMISPVVEAAVADLQARSNPGAEIVRSGAPVIYLARIRFGPEMRTVCVGTVYQAAAGDPQSCSIHLDRAGRLSWRRD